MSLILSHFWCVLCDFEGLASSQKFIFFKSIKNTICLFISRWISSFYYFRPLIHSNCYMKIFVNKVLKNLKFMPNIIKFIQKKEKIHFSIYSEILWKSSIVLNEKILNNIVTINFTMSSIIWLYRDVKRPPV
jgi:hypothetical protein